MSKLQRQKGFPWHRSPKTKATDRTFLKASQRHFDRCSNLPRAHSEKSNPQTQVSWVSTRPPQACRLIIVCPPVNERQLSTRRLAWILVAEWLVGKAATENVENVSSQLLHQSY